MNISISGEQSKDARTSLSKSQGEVSRETGITRAYLSQFENGIRKLTPSELSTLRSYYKDEGFIFDDSISGKISSVNDEVSNVQRRIDSLPADSELASVNVVELGNLISQIEDIVSIQSISSNQKQNDSTGSGFLLETDNKPIFDAVNARYSAGEKALEKFFNSDSKGSLPEPTFFNTREYRGDKVIHLMALQYLRRYAMEKGISLIETAEFKGLPLVSKGKDSNYINSSIQEDLAKETTIDSYFTEAAFKF